MWQWRIAGIVSGHADSRYRHQSRHHPHELSKRVSSPPRLFFTLSVCLRINLSCLRISITLSSRLLFTLSVCLCLGKTFRLSRLTFGLACLRVGLTFRLSQFDIGLALGSGLLVAFAPLLV